MKEEILRVVRIFGISGKGILPFELANIMFLDKSNVIDYLEELEQENKIKRENQQAPYFPTDEYYKDPLLNASLFGTSFGRLIESKYRLESGQVKKKRIIFRKKDQPYIVDGKEIGSDPGEIKIDTEFKQYDEQYDFTKYEKCYVPNSIENNLIEFSDNIGAFVIRTIIEALSQENYGNLGGREQQTIAREFVNRAISKSIPSLIPAFIDLIEEKTPSLTNTFYNEEEDTIFYGWRCLECSSVIENIDRNAINEFISDHQEKTKHTKGKWHEYDDYDHYNSDSDRSEPVKSKVKDSITLKQRTKKVKDKFLFEDSLSRKLKQSLTNTHQAHNHEFDKIFQNLPNDMESYKRFTEGLFVHFQNKARKQKICEHKFRRPTMMYLYGFYGKQCSECGKIVRVKASQVNKRNL